MVPSSKYIIIVIVAMNLALKRRKYKKEVITVFLTSVQEINLHTLLDGIFKIMVHV
jgi:hypothetical protein